MSFGNKRLDAAYDRWVTRTPEEAGYYEDDEDDEDEDDFVKDPPEPDMTDWANVPEGDEPVDITKDEDEEDE